MWIAVVIAFVAISYLLVKLHEKITIQSNFIESQIESLNKIRDNISELQTNILKLHSAIETITPDEARVDELVRLGFDRGDALEAILTKRYKDAL